MFLIKFAYNVTLNSVLSQYFMNSSEIITQIDDTLERLDLIIQDWAKAKADKNYSDEYKKIALNLAKSVSDQKTVSGKEQEAYTSEDYKKYLWKAFEVDTLFYQLEGRKTTLEKKVDALRSRLSFEKFMQERTI